MPAVRNTLPRRPVGLPELRLLLPAAGIEDRASVFVGSPAEFAVFGHH